MFFTHSYPPGVSATKLCTNRSFILGKIEDYISIKKKFTAGVLFWGTKCDGFCCIAVSNLTRNQKASIRFPTFPSLFIFFAYHPYLPSRPPVLQDINFRPLDIQRSRHRPLSEANGDVSILDSQRLMGGRRLLSKVEDYVQKEND